ncbi:MAG: RNase adapter RapZ [Jiangellales bacterium]
MPFQPVRGTDLLVITGMSGAGKSAVANVLEDLGWWVVDNIPPRLLPQLVETVGTHGAKLAIVADVRGGELFAELDDAVRAASNPDRRPTVLFLEASDEVLVRRFESARRPHPLQGEGRILDGIVAERQVLSALRSGADLVVDTSSLTIHQLGHRVRAAFADEVETLRVIVLSFGFKYGIPVDADLVADLRFLPNPFWVPELRPHTGRDATVRDYVLGQERAGAFLAAYTDVLDTVLPGYLAEGKRFATLAVGCTGGKHRSVAVGDELTRILTEKGYVAHAVHRDLGRE